MKYSEQQRNEYKKQIYELVHKFPDTFGKKLKSKSFKYLYDFVIAMTPLLTNPIYNMATKCYWIINDITDWQHPLVLCPHCHKPLKNKNAKVFHGYRRPHCSRSCSQADVNVYSKIIEKKRLKYGSVCNNKKGLITKYLQTYAKMVANAYETLITPAEEFLIHKKDRKFFLTYRCNKCGRIFKSRSRYFIKDGITHNARCYHCFPTLHSRSKAEIELYNFCEQICKENNIEILHNDRSIAKLANNRPVDFDISIPTLKLLIEFNGLYYHSLEFMEITKQKYPLKKTTRIQRLDKTLMAEKQGYKLIHIEEYEWKYNKQNIMDFLKSIITCTFYFENTTYLIIDRAKHNKNDIPIGYILIDEINPQLHKIDKYHFYDCGYLIYKKLKK